MCGCRTFSLVPGLPSRLSSVGCPPLFEPFIGTTPKSDSWPAPLWVVRLSPFPTGLPLTCASDADQVSRFSCMMFPDVRGVSDCAGSPGGFVLAPPACGLRRMLSDRHPGSVLSQLNTRPARVPIYASPPASRLKVQDSGSGWVTTPFL